METQKTYPIKVKFNVGLVKINIKWPHPPKGTCKNCGKLIYWLKLCGRKKKVQLSHVRDNEYVAHPLVCPTVLAFEQKIKFREYNKKQKSNVNT